MPGRPPERFLIRGTPRCPICKGGYTGGVCQNENCRGDAVRHMRHQAGDGLTARPTTDGTAESIPGGYRRVPKIPRE